MCTLQKTLVSARCYVPHNRQSVRIKSPCTKRDAVKTHLIASRHLGQVGALPCPG